MAKGKRKSTKQAAAQAEPENTQDKQENNNAAADEPAPKKQKSVGKKGAKKQAPAKDFGGQTLYQISQQHWASTDESLPEYDAQLIELIYTHEKLHSTTESQQAVMLLEFSSYLEKYLWPHYDPETATRNHKLSILIMINEKFREGVSAWDALLQESDKFSQFLTSVLQMWTEDELSIGEKTTYTHFMVRCFQSLEVEAIRRICLRMVSLPCWCEIDSDRRDYEFFKTPKLKRHWKTLNDKRPDLATSLEATFVSGLLNGYFEILDNISVSEETERVQPEYLMFVHRFCELVIDLLAQLPTRRFLLALITDKHFITRNLMSKLAKMPEDGRLFRQLTEMAKFYTEFEMNEHSGSALSKDSIIRRHYTKSNALQRIAFKHFQEELLDLALATVSEIQTRKTLKKHLDKLSEPRLRELCSRLRLLPRQGDEESDHFPNLNKILKSPTRQFMEEVLLAHHEARISQIEAVNAMSLYPTEDILWDENVVPSELFFGERVLALPKLNLQFLTFHDYLLRNFNLFRLESTFEIRDDINDVCERVQPNTNPLEPSARFSGWARMAHVISHFQIREVKKPKLGENVPARVVASLTIDLAGMNPKVREEWESLRQHDTLFLLSFYDTPNTYQDRMASRDALKTAHEIALNEAKRQHQKLQELGSTKSASNLRVPKQLVDARVMFGLQHVRGCEVVWVKDEAGEIVEDGRFDTSQKPRAGNRREIRIEMDAAQYQADQNADKNFIYERFNLVMRRKAKENNFKAVLATIRDLMNTEVILPTWLVDVFLGYGDPQKSLYKSLPPEMQQLEVNFNDTFVDLEHLKSSFPNHKLEFDEPPARDDGREPVLEPPFRLTFPEPESEDNTIRVCSFIPPNPGPYPDIRPPMNKVRFTPVQVDAIRIAMNPGLSMVVGPPGTGKTDVAVQIISNIYHNFPGQRTLLVTHSNHALNDLFEKIMQRDIDERHLLRLGRGEELLETEKDFSKWGRVNYMLQRRLELLARVEQLGQCLGVIQDVSQSCETAGHFNLNHVIRRWEEFLTKCKPEDTTAAKNEIVKKNFPFTEFFSDAPKLFVGDFDKDMEVAEGCYRFIQKIFDELKDCRAFELLRTAYDRSNYLLTKQARVIAMTCTHAAITRANLIELAFEYDNLLMEETAQIMEIETFIPMVLQKNDQDKCRLKRLILIGDHHQLPPVVKNMAFQKYSHLDQSLFTRFIRLGVPHIELNCQGRARASIAELYKWRYKSLEDLPHVFNEDRFQLANAGLAYDYQLINVEDYQGRGEFEPTPHFTQNLGEAEYVVAMFQYLRLLGVPASSISIITTYRGQKHLIRDVVRARCGANPLFGEPAKISTTDKFQGQQNDFVLLSLVRTRMVGHIRDIRRLVVSMSRARLGFYVFCRQSVFADCFELKEVFGLLGKRPNKLALVQGELHPTTRRAADAVDESKVTQVQDVFHMGAIVGHLLQFRHKQIQASMPQAVEPQHQPADQAMEDAQGAKDAQGEQGGAEGQDAELNNSQPTEAQ